MSQPLAKVTSDLDQARGPDVVFSIVVSPRWFGHTVNVELPRNLNCARCEGGGCDDCQRGGAVSLRDRDDDTHSISVSLPVIDGVERDLRLRIPHQGGASPDPTLGRGHLFLTVRSGSESSPGVSLVDANETEERRALVKQSLIMAAGLILLFFVMLRLSGWL
jgi:hypothetical protein